MKIPFKSILITLLPAYGYLSAYAYEKGFLNSFRIPDFFIQVRIESVVISSLLISVIACMCFLIGLATLHLLNERKSKLNWHIFVIVPASCLWSIGVFLITGLPIISIFCFFIVIYACYFVLYPLLVNYKPNMTTVEKLNVHLDKTTSKMLHRDTILHYILANNLVNFFLATLSTAILVFGMGYLYGRFHGSSQTLFLVGTMQNKQYVLLRMYGDERIFAEVNEKNGIMDRFVIINDTESLNLTIKDIKR